MTALKEFYIVKIKRAHCDMGSFCVINTLTKLCGFYIAYFLLILFTVIKCCRTWVKIGWGGTYEY